MARISARVKLNRAALDQVFLGLSDGLFEVGKAIVVEAGTHAPDSPYDPFPTGEGLPKNGGVIGYAAGGKVNSWSIRGESVRKPRGLGTEVRTGDSVVAAGFGFPGRFAELGTIHEHARPFLTPAAARIVGSGAGVILSKQMQAKIGTGP
jgi:hypothetical protein